MNHDRPRLVANVAGLHVSNSVYGIRLNESRRQLGKELLPIASLDSITLLGAEVVGRSYGGGLLKLEPREADNLPVLSLSSIVKYKDELKSIQPQLAEFLRSGDVLSATDAVDKIVLRDIPQEKIDFLRTAREFLFQRRKSRAKNV